jgi:hypothetical protein
MKLTDAERLILINQYTILSHLRPEGNWRYMAEELEQGFYENEGYNFSSDLQPSIPADRLDLADSVIDLFEEKGWPFYGFQDPELNRYARYRDVVEMAKGTPPSDDEYRAMLAKQAA